MPISKKRKKAIKPLVTISEIDFVKYMAKERKDAREAMNKTVTAMLNIFLVSVRDEFGIGPARMKRLGERVSGIIKAIEKDELDPSDIDTTLLEEIGINADLFINLGQKAD